MRPFWLIPVAGACSALVIVAVDESDAAFWSAEGLVVGSFLSAALLFFVRQDWGVGAGDFVVRVLLSLLAALAFAFPVGFVIFLIWAVRSLQ